MSPRTFNSAAITGTRKSQELSAYQLARKANLNLSVLLKIEDGRTPNPTINTVLAIANALGVSPMEFLN